MTTSYQPAAIASTSTETVTAYLVDDDAGINAALSLFLGHRKIQVQSHLSAEQFLQAFEPKPRACVIIDYRLPDMTGAQALDELARLGHEPPAILMTGHGPPVIHFEDRIQPLIKVLLKPFEPDELSTLIKQATQERRP